MPYALRVVCKLTLQSHGHNSGRNIFAGYYLLVSKRQVVHGVDDAYRHFLVGLSVGWCDCGVEYRRILPTVFLASWQLAVHEFVSSTHEMFDELLSHLYHVT